MTTEERARTVIHRIDEIPMFTDEAAEAEWWSTHEPGPELFEGASFPPEVEGLLPPVRKLPPTRLISLRLGEDIIDRLKALGERRGIGYQTMLKELLLRALPQAEAFDARVQAEAHERDVAGYALSR